MTTNKYRTGQKFYQRASDLGMCSHNKLIHEITLFDHLKKLTFKHLLYNNVKKKMSVFTLETGYPSETDNPSSKSVKIDG